MPSNLNTTDTGGNGTMPPSRFHVQPLPGANFGGLVEVAGIADARAAIAAAEAEPEALPAALCEARGFLLLRGMGAISEDPELLVRLSRLFGPEVEDYNQTLVKKSTVHRDVPEIFIVSNVPPVNKIPPARPNPPLTEDGKLPTRFPHRRGWHTDQSYRRPPPDISLFYAVQPSPKGQGQTLFANGILAYEALPPELRARVEGLDGIHSSSANGRTEYAVRDGNPPKDLEPHEAPQRQPVVRTHPVTGEKALYLCEAGQMDWIDGPFVGLEPGPDGEGGKLLYEIMRHYTRPEFVYAHEWEANDLVIWDNRSLIHSSTWFDADKVQRVMWRTTVRGNPGGEYDGERRSWIPV